MTDLSVVSWLCLVLVMPRSDSRGVEASQLILHYGWLVPLGFVIGTYGTLIGAGGVAIGAQLGALLSNRVRGAWIIRGLAVALAFVGIRILVMAM